MGVHSLIWGEGAEKGNAVKTLASFLSKLKDISGIKVDCFLFLVKGTFK